MVVGEIASSTEVLVIGGGPGGYAAALRSAQLGRRVTLVEERAIGGVCLNVGCIPSKVLIHAAGIAGLGEEAAASGVDLEARPDLVRIRERMLDAIGRLTGGVERLLEGAKVERFGGRARFVRPDRVAVVEGEDIRHIEFEEAIVATGSRPAALPSLPFDGERVLDSTAALALTELPRSLAVVGGGYIGVELGTAFAKLGVEVTLIEVLDRLLPQLEARLGKAVKRRLELLGVRLLLGTSAGEPTDAGLLVRPVSEEAGEPDEVRAEKILVAAGRLPNTAELGLDVVGARLEDGGRIIVDASRRAGRRVLALGDVTAGPALAHKATAEAEVAALTAAGKRAAFEPAAVPQIVFCDPEVASVGLTRDEAVSAGIEVESFRFPLGASGRAQTLRRSTLGHVEVVAEADGTVLGVHMAGPRVSELAGEAALAVEMAATLEDLALTIHPHPTFSEALGEAAWGALGKPLHSVRVGKRGR